MGFIKACSKRHVADEMGETIEIVASKHALTTQDMSMLKHIQATQNIQHTQLIFLLHCVN